MTPIGKYISELLLRQDNVVVPNLGGFVARRIPARFSEDGTKFFPPFKQLLFHAHINLSDGIFERYVAHREQLSLKEATNIINTAINQWHFQLKNGERIELDHVGYLFKDKENKIRFEQERSVNLLLQSYGLNEIVFERAVDKEVLATSDAEVTDAHKEATISIDFNLDESNPIETNEKTSESAEKLVLIQDGVSPKGVRRNLWMKVAAAAVVIPLTFYSFWVPLTTDVLQTKKIAFADFNPFHQVASAKYASQVLSEEEYEQEPMNDLDQIVNALPEDVLFYNFNYDEELILPVRLERKVTLKQETAERIEHENNSNAKAKSANKIHLISGCFSQKENADNHIAALKPYGFDAYIVDIQGGLHRVAAVGVSTESEITSASAQLKKHDIAFWTLKK